MTVLKPPGDHSSCLGLDLGERILELLRKFDD